MFHIDLTTTKTALEDKMTFKGGVITVCLTKSLELIIHKECRVTTIKRKNRSNQTYLLSSFRKDIYTLIERPLRIY
jgi:hypothetical protein